jgi:hypothetical protein
MVSTAVEAFDDIYSIASVALLPIADGTHDVIVSAHHQVFYPNVVTRLSSRGQVVGRYWHAGHIGNAVGRLRVHDLDLDGEPEILLSGVSNGRNAGTFVVLDPDRMDGAAGESDPGYHFQELPAAREIGRVFFPRSSLTPPVDRYTPGSTIVPGRSTVTVSVEQSVTRPALGHVLYTFDRSLGLTGVTAGDSFIGSFRREQAEGRINWTLEEELTRLERVFLLKPARAAESQSAAAPGPSAR